MSWREQRRARTAKVVRDEIEGQVPGQVWNIFGLKVDPDGLFALGLFLPMLFMANIGTMGAAVIAGLVPLYLFVRRERLTIVMLKRAFLFSVPLLAMMSVVWSEAPRETFKYAAELGLTVIAGLLISSARNQEAVIRGLGLAFFAYTGISVFGGGYVGVGVGAGGQAFSGLTESKNLLADIASTGAIVSMAVVALAIRSRAWMWAVFGVAAFLLEVYAVTAARSAGALLGLGIGVCAMVGLLILVAAGKALRAFLTGVLASVLVAVGLSYRWVAQTMIEIGANVFDKDPTLTGRTYLWYRAADLIDEKPMLGRGYYAFWLQGNVDAEGLWRYFGIESRGGFTFHNTAVEILVTLGLVGLVLLSIVLIIGILALVKRFVERPNLALVCWISLLLYQLCRMPIETIGIAPFYFSTALCFASLGAAFGRVDSKKIVRTAYRNTSPRVVQVWPVEDVAPGWANPRWAPEPGAMRLLRADTAAQPRDRKAKR
jgi:exopolysaccharide production protein ExoQ